ncbi:hypothetical protein Zmor_012163 [Zophobas morio]|jgi:hypothetical protein|uniref:Reverse transcriptase domain-containing protein n=1 Tax=Zophobas morio TaxID=2755281 RepID=A0AA38HH48_9CUCU|nr:hypothetical protein Zmor_012163 [Zophobas morio]
MGVPLDALLSLILFALYMSDIPRPEDTSTFLSQFADDTAVHTGSKSPCLALKHLKHMFLHLMYGLITDESQLTPLRAKLYLYGRGDIKRQHLL